MKLTPFLLLCATVVFSQVDWKTSTVLPGVDLTGLSAAQKNVALSVMRSEACGCGCDMKIAQCRLFDPKCAVSRRWSDMVVKDAAAGKSVEAIRAAIVKLANEPPPLLEAPVKLSIDGDPMRGPADAKVTIVEFSDFQCPYCAKAIGEVNQVLAKYPKDVRLVFKQFPLDTHSQAGLAAEAALAAQAQGKFWEMHDKLYANFRAINRDRILAWAKEIGLDMTRFPADLSGHKYASRVASEGKQGDDAGVEGTPTFFINGKRLNASFELGTVAPLIAQELKR
ncbi:MAG TPA: thioredoxin domain-containing protein [Bryobacteraceae bacterium]|nr:thioredoxin domain-containing protein [Bryobacteraceae bacterium]